MNQQRIETPTALVSPPVNPQPLTPVNDTMRRLQIGIAGVFTVVLLVGMAGLIGDRARERVEADAVEASTVKLPGDVAAPGSAPLEELGVQPVSKDAKENNAAESIKVPQAAPSTVPDLEPDPALERARQSAQ